MVILLNSTDGGNSWSTVWDTSDVLFTDFVMFDTTSGLIVSSLYNSFLTNDKGESWSSESHSLTISSASLKINDSTAIIGTTENYSITTDKGQNWSGGGFVQAQPKSFFATAQDSIYAVSEGATGVFFSYTFNSGSDWNDNPISDFSPRGLYVVDTSEVYVVGQCISSNTCRIVKSTDMGETWSFYDTEIEGTLYDIKFLSDTIALISGSDGLLIKWDKNSKFEVAKLFEPLAQKGVYINAYPNPSNNLQTLAVNLDQPKEGSIRLIDMHGKHIKQIYEGRIEGGRTTFTIDVGSLRSGVYFYSVIFENEEPKHLKVIRR